MLVVELVMERGGAEGLKHQVKVRSCGATRHCAISKGTLGWRRRLGNVRINILYDLMSHTGSLDL